MFTAVYVSASPLTLLLCEHAMGRRRLRAIEPELNSTSPSACWLQVRKGKESKCARIHHHRHPRLTQERRTRSAPASAIASRPRKRPWNAPNIRPWIRHLHRRRMREAMWANSRSTTIVTAKRHTKPVAVRSRRKRQGLGIRIDRCLHQGRFRGPLERRPTRVHRKPRPSNKGQASGSPGDPRESPVRAPA